MKSKIKAKVYFFLQPVGSWCSKQKTKEEKILFDDERKDKKLQKIYQHVDKKKYLIVKDTTKKAALPQGHNKNGQDTTKKVTQTY